MVDEMIKKNHLPLMMRGIIEEIALTPAALIIVRKMHKVALVRKYWMEYKLYLLIDMVVLLKSHDDDNLLGCYLLL
jgi:hypothetical protein